MQIPDNGIICVAGMDASSHLISVATNKVSSKSAKTASPHFVIDHAKLGNGMRLLKLVSNIEH
jgi:hypothetical protein